MVDDSSAYYGGGDVAYPSYYGDVGQVNQSTWVTGQGDVTGFTNTNMISGNGDLFYVGNHQQVRTTRG